MGWGHTGSAPLLLCIQNLGLDHPPAKADYFTANSDLLEGERGKEKGGKEERRKKETECCHHFSVQFNNTTVNTLSVEGQFRKPECHGLTHTCF